MPRRYYKRHVQTTWYGDDFLAIVRQHGDEALFAAGQHVMGAAIRKAPTGRTGNLRKSAYVATNSRTTYKPRHGWRHEKKPPIGAATVAFSAPHAHLLEGGRRSSGKIVPRPKRRYGVPRKALKIGNRFVARSRFKRMRGRHFLANAVEETKETMVRELSAVLRSKLERTLPFRR